MDAIKKLLGFLIFDILETVAIALGIFIVIYVFLSSPHIVIGHSMDYSFADGEFLLTDKISYRFHEPARGDVIVFKFDPTHDYIKRIIGLPGDKVYLNNGYVYVNGEKLDESAYVSPGNLTYGIKFLQNNEQITVPANHYFVLGDNRDESSDSRDWGFVDRTAIDGRAWVVYWPIKSFEFVPSVKYTQEGSTLVAKE